MLFWGDQAPWPTADRILKPCNKPFVEPSGGDLVPVLSHTLKVKCDLFGVVYEVLIAEKSHENKKLEWRNSRIIGVRESCRVNTVAFSKQTIRYLPFVCCSCSCFQSQPSSSSLSAGCKNHSALKDLRNSAIVLNLNGFRPRRTDGCVHSQIRRSIVQNPLFSLFNRTLSFSHCCLLWPLYHSASQNTLYTYTLSNTQPEAHTVLLFFSI